MAAPRRRMTQVLAPGQVPIENHNFREFGGINTQAARQAIQKEQFAWLENVMPIGPGNAKTVYQSSAALATIAGGRSVYYTQTYNISNTSYAFCACTDGSAWQVLLANPYTVTQIAAGGTFPSSGTQIAQWKNERILIVNATNYWDWNGAALTLRGGTTGAPVGGTHIATYSGRVWICNGRVLNYSAAASYTDFTGTGGSTTITDETLTSDIQQLIPANNFLYFFGVDSINVIADVQVVAGVTQFSNTNLVANSGTDLVNAIFPYFRSIWYMNESGIYALYGATPRKASDDLDGIFQNIDFTKPVTGGTVTLFNILCAAFLFTYNDPVQGARQLMAIYFNKKWYVASQSAAMTVMAASHSSTDVLWGANGANIYQLFSNSTSAISQTIKTALWDFSDFFPIKQSLRVGVEAVLPSSTGALTVTVDSELSSQSPSVPFAGSFAFTWVNNANATVSWVNGSNVAFTWLASGYEWFQGDVEQDGHYLGVTLTSTTAGIDYSGIQLQYRKIPATWGA